MEIFNNNVFSVKASMLILSAAINFFVAVLLMVKPTRISNKPQKDLVYANLSVALWLISSLINHVVLSIDLVTLFTKISYAAAIIAIASIIAFAKHYRGSRMYYAEIVWALLMVLWVILTNTVVLIGLPSLSGEAESMITGDYFGLWSIAAILLGVYAVYQLSKALIESKGEARRRVEFFIALIIICISAVLFFNTVLSAFNLRSFIFVGQSVTIIFAIATSWIFIQERLYSAYYLIVKLLSIFTAAIVLFSLSFGTQRFEQLVLGWDLENYRDPKIIGLGFFVALVVSLFITPLLEKISRIYFYVFGIKSYSVESLIDRFILSNNKTLDIDEYLSQYLIEISQILNLQYILVYVPAIENKIWGENSYSKDWQKVKIKERIEIVIDDNNTQYGKIIVGPKFGLDSVSQEEMEVLLKFKNILSTAVTRYVFYKKVANFNETLQHEVDLATEKIKLQRDRIASALRRERDMTDIIGHELRTPLTISRNAIKLLKEELAALRILESNEKLSRYMQMADNNILREMRLLETMLSSTKIENHRLQLRLEKVDLNSAIDDAILGFGDKAKEKKLKVEVNRTPNVNAYADKVRLQEVVDNLFDNAIKYTPAGTITLSLHQHKDEVEIDISDTGTGISKKDLKKLGHKFYRVKTYVNEKAEDRSKVIRPGGTGLGLFVVFGLVKAMNGRIEVDSTEGKGTTFKVFLPKFSKKLQVQELDK